VRILWLCHFVPYPATGHGALQRTHQLLIRSAESQTIGVIALAPRTDTDDAQLIEARQFLEPRLAFLDLIPPSRGVFNSRPWAFAAAAVGRRSYWEHSLWSGAMRQTMVRRITEFRPDLVHFDTIYLARYVEAAGGCRVVLTHHNIESKLLAERASVEKRGMRWFVRGQGRRVAELEKRLAPAVASNVVVSEADAATLQRIAPGAPVSVVPNGVDTDFFSATHTIAPTPKSLIFVGSMDWYPNRLAMDWLAAELWPALAHDDPERRMTVVGRNPPPSIVNASRADGRIAVTGFVDDVRPYMQRASIYICPIRVGGGTRLKILDALAMERPLVSTALGVSGLGLKDGCHYLQAETVSDFVAQVRRLEADPELAARLATAGRKFVVDHYAWPAVTDRLVGAFAAAANTRAIGTAE